MNKCSKPTPRGIGTVEDGFIYVVPEVARGFDALKYLSERLSVRVLNLRLEMQRGIVRGEPTDMPTLQRAIAMCEHFLSDIEAMENALKRARPR